MSGGPARLSASHLRGIDLERKVVSNVREWQTGGWGGEGRGGWSLGRFGLKARSTS